MVPALAAARLIVEQIGARRVCAPALSCWPDADLEPVCVCMCVGTLVLGGRGGQGQLQADARSAGSSLACCRKHGVIQASTAWGDTGKHGVIQASMG